MTRNWDRAKCIKAQCVAVVSSRGLHWGDLHPVTQQLIIDEQTAAFDSLHDIARVNLIEATEEMVAAMNIHSNTSPENTFRVMARKGDLTNAQEKKI